MNDFVSDYYSIYSTRKKKKENHENISRTVRGYSAFDKETFQNLFAGSRWDIFDQSMNVDIQWETILKKVQNILTVMFSYKK